MTATSPRPRPLCSARRLPKASSCPSPLSSWPSSDKSWPDGPFPRIPRGSPSARCRCDHGSCNQERCWRTGRMWGKQYSPYWGWSPCVRRSWRRFTPPHQMLWVSRSSVRFGLLCPCGLFDWRPVEWPRPAMGVWPRLNIDNRIRRAVVDMPAGAITSDDSNS